jgi:cysteine synthase B
MGIGAHLARPATNDQRPTVKSALRRSSFAVRPSSFVSQRPGVLARVGNTPLIRIRRIKDGLSPAVEVFAKAEWFNPGGSVKDRPALRMIEEGERSGRLTPDKIIIDSTSGNTGIAYALVSAVKGYRVNLVMPGNVSEERKALARAYGAELILSNPLEGTDGALRTVRQIVADSRERYFYPDQYNNPANWWSHYETTGPEIIVQTRGRVTHLVAGIGTSGTLMGTARRLKEHNPRVQAIAVEPTDELQVIEGLKHMETSIVPGIYDASLPDQIVPIGADEAYEMTCRLATEEGLFVGFSAGAAMAAALRLGRDIDRGVIVVIFPDSGLRYLSLNPCQA